MITAELVARINELAQKQRAGLLTDAEKLEQTVLRQKYVAGIREQVRSQLEAAGIKPKGHTPGCDCGCTHRH